MERLNFLPSFWYIFNGSPHRVENDHTKWFKHETLLNPQLKLTKEISLTQKLISSVFAAYPLTCPFRFHTFSFHYQTITTSSEENNFSYFLWMIDSTI